MRNIAGIGNVGFTFNWLSANMSAYNGVGRPIIGKPKSSAILRQHIVVA